MHKSPPIIWTNYCPLHNLYNRRSIIIPFIHLYILNCISVFFSYINIYFISQTNFLNETSNKISKKKKNEMKVMSEIIKQVFWYISIHVDIYVCMYACMQLSENIRHCSKSQRGTDRLIWWTMKFNPKTWTVKKVSKVLPATI